MKRDAMTDTGSESSKTSDHARLWVERIALTGFRNYATATLAPGPGPIVLIGANGAGKTNLLEAVSLLAPGQGLIWGEGKTEQRPYDVTNPAELFLYPVPMVKRRE